MCARSLEPTFGVPARRPTVSVPARLAAVLDAAVDAPARPDGAAVPDAAAYGVYPLIILIVYVIVTGGILCSDHCGSSPTTRWALVHILVCLILRPT